MRSLLASAEVPRQQFLDAVDRMIGDALEHVAQIRLGVQPIEFGRLHQAVDRRGALATGVGAEEQVVLATQADPAQRALGSIVVDFDAPVLAVAGECLLVRERVADGFRQIRCGRHASEHLAQPGVKVLQQRCRAFEAFSSALVRRAAPDVGLDLVQLGDALVKITGDLRHRAAKRPEAARRPS